MRNSVLGPLAATIDGQDAPRDGYEITSTDNTIQTPKGNDLNL